MRMRNTRKYQAVPPASNRGLGTALAPGEWQTIEGRKMADVIRYRAQVYKLQTLVDGGIRLTLDLVQPIDNDTIIKLLEAKQPGLFLESAFVLDWNEYYVKTD